jgi:hypothetical protein
MSNRRYVGIFSLLALVTLCSCATMPAGPSVMVMPPDGKSFEQFQIDDAICRQWAAQQIGLSPQNVANQNTVSGAVVGTVVGAGLGAAIGSTSGDAGAGAAIGAASGLLIGSAAGADSGQVYGWQAQRRYDIAYMQCMYAKGNRVPGGATQPRRIRRMGPQPPPPDLNNMPPDLSSPHSAPAYPPEK